MLKVGLTGNIGSGKTFAAEIFQSLGIPVFFADKEAGNLYSHEKVKNQVRELFGDVVFEKQGIISRSRLAEIVFNDQKLLEKLNHIIHPVVLQEYNLWLEKYTNTPYSLYEAAILFESGHYKDMDRIICVTAPEEVRINRVVNRNGISPEEVRIRMAHQWDESRKANLADFVIINDGIIEVRRQVEKIHQQIMIISDNPRLKTNN